MFSQTNFLAFFFFLSWCQTSKAVARRNSHLMSFQCLFCGRPHIKLGAAKTFESPSSCHMTCWPFFWSQCHFVAAWCFECSLCSSLSRPSTWWCDLSTTLAFCSSQTPFLLPHFSQYNPTDPSLRGVCSHTSKKMKQICANLCFI